MLTSGKLSASNMRLPTYIEATKPQNTFGCSFTSVGPGGTPWIISAAISTAVIGPVGRPSASLGTNAAVEAALFAASGPATPAPERLPDTSGNMDSRLGATQASKRERICAEAGV